MRGRYKVIEKQAKLGQGVVASLRIDCWNGKGLTKLERQQVLREAADWAVAVLSAEARRARVA